jgi:predicted acetyltransferase
MDLILANHNDLPGFQEMAGEFQASGNNGFAEALRNPRQFMEVVLADMTEPTVFEGRVPQRVYWPKVDNLIMGWGDLRPRLTDALRQYGGNLGFAIRPSQRRKGYGTALFRLLIAEAWRMDLRELLVTCDDDNVPSWRIIESSGGVLQSEGISPMDNKKIRRYLIEANQP